MTPERAYRITRTAIKAGKLVRANRCERCGAPDMPTKDGRSYIHAHHADHNKPLSVEWLCAKCHRGITPLPKKMGAPNYGSKNGFSKLTERQVLEIRKSQGTNMSLAQKYGVCNATISHIRIGRSWKWLAAYEEQADDQ